MKISIALFIILFPFKVFSWGFLGHQTINKHAVFALPTEMFGLYKLHIDYLTKHSTDADNRRYLLDNEACKHFLDCDHYEKKSPLDSLPIFWKDAVIKYSEDTLLSHGIVPWQCQLMLYNLTEAFKEKSLYKILKLSADIGHYIADAHVPLHATSNYNGQKTGQEGIHALWETRIVKLQLDSFDLFSGSAIYLEKPAEYIFARVGESYAASDSVLQFEKTITQQIGEENKYVLEFKGRESIKTYSEYFCEAYHLSLDEMAEKRMRLAIFSVASFWYTAWVNAGQPDLNSLMTVNIDDDKEFVELQRAGENKKMKGREE